MEPNTDEFLAHYGVKGMHWGRRKAENRVKLARISRAGASEDFIKSREAKAKARKSGTKSLTNAELQTAITRMNLERQYNTLSPSATSKGKKIAGDILENTGKQIAADYVKEGLKAGIKYGVKAAIKK